MAYEVQTQAYAGPFDLLLHLILKDEVDLYEVSLMEIVDAYLAELDKLEDMNLEMATEFLLIAATLVELKSRRLLPDDDGLLLDDELALWEERDLLLARLLECKTFKDASVALEGLAQIAAHSYPRRAGMEEQFVDLVPDLLEGCTPEKLYQGYLKATAPKPKLQIDLFHVTEVKLTVAETVMDLVHELPHAGKTSFRDLTRSLVERIEVVVHFLALLELYKQGLVELGQFKTFGDIEVQWIGGDRRGMDIGIDDYEG